MTSSSVGSLLTGFALDDAIEDIARDAEEVLVGVDAAGVAVHRATGKVLGASNPLAASVDADQYRIGRGPCLRAFRTNRVVVLDVDGHRRRWPAFEARALAAGVRTVLSVPLRLDGRAIGSLNLYSLARQAFSAPAVRQAEVFARPAGLRLSQTGIALHAAEAASVAVLELRDRAVVEQALGVLMAVHADLSVERARLRLQQAATDLGLDVRATAGRIIGLPPGQAV